MIHRYQMAEKIMENIVNKIKESGISAYEPWNSIKHLIEKKERRELSREESTWMYYFIGSPLTFDHEKQKEKKDILEKSINLGRFILNLEKNKAIKLNPEKRSIKTDQCSYFKVFVNFYELEIHIEFTNKAKEKIKNLTKKNKKIADLKDFVEAMKIELENTKNHIKWLEEKINFQSEIFRRKSNKKAGKITTRKLIVKGETDWLKNKP